MRNLLFILILSHGLVSFAQRVELTEPWALIASVHGEGDTIYSVGMSNIDTGSKYWGMHRIRLTKRTGDRSYYESRIVNFMGDYKCGVATANNVIKTDSFIAIACYSIDSLDKPTGYLWKLDHKLQPIDTFQYKLGYTMQARALAYDTTNEVFLIYGDHFKTEKSRRGNFLLEINKDMTQKRVTTFECKDYPKDGGCRSFAKQVFPLKGGKKLLVNQKYAATTFHLSDPHILLLDSNNKVLNKIQDIELDSFSLYSTMVVQLNDTVFVALNEDSYYKPYMKEPDNPNSSWHFPTDAYLTTFQINGTIIEQNKLDQELRFKLIDRHNSLEANHAIRTNDGGAAFTGITDYSTSLGLRVGFMLKTSNAGEFEWFRKYQINACTPSLGDLYTRISR